ncbi:MAG TPA: hypothetical protein V6C85_09355 [Allocoleopsis sp.]
MKSIIPKFPVFITFKAEKDLGDRFSSRLQRTSRSRTEQLRSPARLSFSADNGVPLCKLL